MKVGYARVSTDEQELDLQREALRHAGCEVLHEDHGYSGASAARPGLAQALAALGPGDVLVVWKLDRLGRSLPHLIDILDRIGRSGAGFMSVSEAIDTTTAGGKLIFHVLGAIAEFERALISERTRAGMDAARRRGVRLGRPSKLTEAQVALARTLMEEGRLSRMAIAAQFGVDVTTLVRALTPSRPLV